MLNAPSSAPYDRRFDDAWLKWGWAVHQAESLKAVLQSALDSDVAGMFTSRSEYHPEFHGFSIVVDHIDRLPEAWGLRLGDVLHGYRSALDNAAWAVVQRGRTPPAVLKEWQRRKVAFPCYDSPKTFRDNLPKKVPGARRADVAVLRWAQPYNIAERFRHRHVLPFVIMKNDLDKHKTIQEVHLANADYIPGTINSFDCVVRGVRSTPPGPINVGAELARVYVCKTGPNPDIQVQAQLGTTIFLNHFLGAAPFFDQTCNWIAAILGRLSECPPGVGKRLGLVP